MAFKVSRSQGLRIMSEQVKNELYKRDILKDIGKQNSDMK